MVRFEFRSNEVKYFTFGVLLSIIIVSLTLTSAFFYHQLSQDNSSTDTQFGDYDIVIAETATPWDLSTILNLAESMSNNSNNLLYFSASARIVDSVYQAVNTVTDQDGIETEYEVLAWDSHNYPMFVNNVSSFSIYYFPDLDNWIMMYERIGTRNNLNHGDVYYFSNDNPITGPHDAMVLDILKLSNLKYHATYDDYISDGMGEITVGMVILSIFFGYNDGTDFSLTLYNDFMYMRQSAFFAYDVEITDSSQVFARYMNNDIPERLFSATIIEEFGNLINALNNVVIDLIGE